MNYVRKELAVFSVIFLAFAIVIITITASQIQLYKQNAFIIVNQNPITPPSVRTGLPSLSLLPHVKVYHPIQDQDLGIAKNALPNIHTIQPAATSFVGYSPSDIKRAYNLPDTGGTGTIAVVSAFSAPSAENDLNIFSQQFNLPQCTQANGCLTIHNESGTPPPFDSGWQKETDLDIEWAHAIAPNAKILLVLANSVDTPADLLTEIDYARNQQGVVAISMSWGISEFSQETAFDTYFTSQSGISFFAAAGDLGHGVMWPAVSPNVAGVSGTSLNINGTTITETAWSGSGGGISQFESEPSYQTTYNIPQAQGKRGVPDVSMDADPHTGTLFYTQGSWHLVGGTSLATPIWAGIRSLNQTPITHTLLYQNAKANYAMFYRDITTGSNGLCATYCSTTAGYDYVTGLGSPIALPSSSTVPSSTPIPQLSPTPSTGSGSPTPLSGTSIFITLCPHGIAICGDNANPQSTGNMNPLHTRRSIIVEVSDINNHPITAVQATVNFDSTSGTFKGTVPLSGIASGQYIVKVTMPQYLTKQIGVIQQIIAGQTPSTGSGSSTNTTPEVFLITGDMNGDNKLDILDYNILVNCFGSKFTTASCTAPATSQTPGADLTDDGKIDGVDYNLFLRELSVQNGQ